MNTQQQAFLEKFGSRVTFNKTERVLYGHDIAAMPILVKPLIGDTTPDAVVQPQNEDELIEIVRWAYQEGIPITPRGKGSSGYGGIIPVKKGLVIDFYQMKDVLAVDEEGLTATVEPGSRATFDLLIGGVPDASKVFIGPYAANPDSVPFTLDFAAPAVEYVGRPGFTLSPDSAAGGGPALIPSQ